MDTLLAVRIDTMQDLVADSGTMLQRDTLQDTDMATKEAETQVAPVKCAVTRVCRPTWG